MTHSSPWRAARRMWQRTDLTAGDVDVAGLYDGFTFIALQWLEALGFCGEGESGPFVAEGNARAARSDQHGRRGMQRRPTPRGKSFSSK